AIHLAISLLWLAEQILYERAQTLFGDFCSLGHQTGMWKRSLKTSVLTALRHRIGQLTQRRSHELDGGDEPASDLGRHVVGEDACGARVVLGHGASHLSLGNKLRQTSGLEHLKVMSCSSRCDAEANCQLFSGSWLVLNNAQDA